MQHYLNSSPVYKPAAPLEAALAPSVAVIGDVHGHIGALSALLDKIEAAYPAVPLAFVGDVTHKGPASAETYRTVLDLVDSGRAVMVASNHGASDAKHLSQAMRKSRNIAHAAAELYELAYASPKYASVWHVAQLAGELAGLRGGDALAERIVIAQSSAPLQAKFDRMVVVHGGLTRRALGCDSSYARRVCLYGTPSGRDESGKPVGKDSWVEEWLVSVEHEPTLPTVIYGHVTYKAPRVTKATVGVDTGCGSQRPDAQLTAAIWSGSVATVEFLSVPAV